MVDSTKVTYTNYYSWINDFIIVKNKEIVVGSNKIIEIIDLKDSSLNVISEFSMFTPYLAPDKFGLFLFILQL